MDAGTASDPVDEAAHVGGTLNVGELPDVALDQIRNIGLEEASPAASVGAADRLWVTAAQCPLEIVVTSQVRGGHAKGDAVLEDGGDEAVWAAVYLALGQGVKLDGF